MPMSARLLLLLALLAPCPAVPAAETPETPEAFMQRYAEAIRTEGVGVTVEFVHPDDVARFHAMLSPLFETLPKAQADAMAKSLFGGKTDAAAVAAMPADRFMRGFLRFVEAQAMGGAVGKGGITVREFVLLGSVPEGEVHHFVTRGTVEAAGITMTRLEVVSVKPDGDGWGMLLSGELDGIAQAIKATVGSRPGPGKVPQDKDP